MGEDGGESGGDLLDEALGDLEGDLESGAAEHFAKGKPGAVEISIIAGGKRKDDEDEEV